MEIKFDDMSDGFADTSISSIEDVYLDSDDTKSLGTRTIAIDVDSPMKSTLYSNGKGTILVPSSQYICMSDDDASNLELIRNECAICLDVFEPHQSLARSRYVECSHAFHSECISTWCLEQIISTQAMAELTSDPHTLRTIAKCPCCRQAFALIAGEYSS